MTLGPGVGLHCFLRLSVPILRIFTVLFGLVSPRSRLLLLPGKGSFLNLDIVHEILILDIFSFIQFFKSVHHRNALKTVTFPIHIIVCVVSWMIFVFER